jgi:hypothetical protein
LRQAISLGAPRRALSWKSPAPRHVVAGVLAALPFQGYLMLHATGHVWQVARYGPEILVDVVAVVLAVQHRRRIVSRLQPLLWPIAGLLAFWILTALWNEVSWTTAVIGMRSELRFLPIAIVVTAAADPLRDARLYALVVTAGVSLQVLVALVQVRRGVYYVIGSFEQRHLLGTFLATGCIVIVAAGARGLGVCRLAARVAAALGVAGVVFSASREAAVMLGVAAIAIAFVRFGRGIRIGLAAVTAAALAVIVVSSVTTPATTTFDSRSLLKRWELFFTNGALSTRTNFRMQLLVDNAKLVAATEPALGVGIGTASNPAVINDLTSPVYRGFPGYDLANAIEPFVYDSNWATIVLETGFVGLALLFGLLGYLTWIGIRAFRAHWAGLALAALAPTIAVSGFAGPVLQEPLVSALLWLLAGLATTALPGAGEVRVAERGRPRPARRLRMAQVDAAAADGGERA